MDNSTPDNNELLMRYLDGEMDDYEKESFEMQLRDDETLKQELDDLRTSRIAVRSYALRQNISEVHAEMMKSKGRVVRMTPLQRVIRYTTAAAACVALIFICIQGYNFYKLSPQKLYSENYIAYETSNVRSTTEKELAIDSAFREKRYGEITKMVFHRTPTHHESLIRGLSYLETGDISRAITSFQTILTDSTRIVARETKDAAEFYLSLAYLKNRDFDESIDLMNKINSDPSHIYNERFSSKYIRRVKMLKWR